MLGWDCNGPSFFSMANTLLTTTHSFDTIDPFNNLGGQSLFVSYKVSGILSAPFCGSPLDSLSILCVDECSRITELGNSTSSIEWFLGRILY